MPKMISPIFKFQGTLDALTFVNSVMYGKHVRAKRFTYTKVKINDSLEESKNRIQKGNPMAKTIFDPLREEHHDGGLWSRLVSFFFQLNREGRKPTADLFDGMEVNINRRLETLIAKDYDVTVTTEKKKMTVEVALQRHPVWEHIKQIEGYYLYVVVIYPNFPKNTYKKDQARIDVPTLAAAPGAAHFEFPMPSAKTPYLVLLGVSGYGPKKIGEQPSSRGLRVVKTS